jgi:hypothetical protein
MAQQGATNRLRRVSREQGLGSLCVVAASGKSDPGLSSQLSHASVGAVECEHGHTANAGRYQLWLSVEVNCGSG